MKSDLQAFFGMGLLVTIVNVLPSPALADEVIWKNTETSVAPNVFMAPSSTMTTTRTIETTPTNSILVTPTYPGVPTIADDTISRRTVIVGDRPAAASTSSTTAVVSSSLDNKPNYLERLRLLRQQLDKGTANGWIKADRSAQLSSRLSDLQNRESSVRGAGYLKVDCDSFEKELTGFNIELSHSMEGHSI
jgi:hypothetical protein